MKKIITILAVLLITTNVFAQMKSILPDSSFGIGGVLLNSFNATYTGTPYGMDVQTDGKIVQGVKGIQYPAVRRFFANGTLDTTFGVNGYAVLPYAIQGPSVKVLPNGKILACFGPVSNFGCYIARLTSEGALDSTFGTSGYTTFGNEVHPDWGGAVMNPDIKVLSDNTIRLVFTNFGLQNDTAMIIKMNSDGIVDNAFGTAGRVIINQTVWAACSFILDHNDRIVMSTPTPSGYVLVTRILPNGSIDNSFGSSGYNYIRPDSTQTTQLGVRSAIGVALPDNSAVILLNYVAGSRFSFAIHVKTDGTQDMSYGMNGLAAVNLFWSTIMTGGMALDNGEVLISGQSISTGTFQTYAGQLTVLNTSGKSDSVFASRMPFIYFQYDPNSAGSQYTNVGPMILLAGNKILLAGSTQQSLTWLSRYNYSGFVAGINETVHSVDFSLYPDPADNYVIIKYQSGGNEEVRLKVFDLSGKTVFGQTIKSGHNTYQLVTDNWNAGFYFVEMRSGNRVSCRKLLVQH